MRIYPNHPAPVLALVGQALYASVRRAVPVPVRHNGNGARTLFLDPALTAHHLAQLAVTSAVHMYIGAHRSGQLAGRAGPQLADSVVQCTRAAAQWAEQWGDAWDAAPGLTRTDVLQDVLAQQGHLPRHQAVSAPSTDTLLSPLEQAALAYAALLVPPTAYVTACMDAVTSHNCTVADAVEAARPLALQAGLLLALADRPTTATSLHNMLIIEGDWLDARGTFVPTAAVGGESDGQRQ